MLNAEADALLEEYPLGGCEEHPDVHCCVHAKSNNHFDVGNKPRRLSWAANNVRGP